MIKLNLIKLKIRLKFTTLFNRSNLVNPKIPSGYNFAARATTLSSFENHVGWAVCDDPRCFFLLVVLVKKENKGRQLDKKSKILLYKSSQYAIRVACVSPRTIVSSVARDERRTACKHRKMCRATMVCQFFASDSP